MSMMDDPRLRAAATALPTMDDLMTALDTFRESTEAAVRLGVAMQAAGLLDRDAHDRLGTAQQAAMTAAEQAKMAIIRIGVTLRQAARK